MMFEIIIVAFIIIGLVSGVYLAYTWGDGNYD